MNKKYPFDPFLLHHLFISLGFAIWIFVFLYFTEPLEINVFSNNEKNSYLPFYALFGGVTYILILPFQKWLYKKNINNWRFKHEALLLIVFLIFSLLINMMLFQFISIKSDKIALPNFSFFTLTFIPSVLTLLPIIILSRWAIGKYYEKKVNEEKIEIKGDGNYEGLKLFLNDLVYVKSSDNYIEISYLETNTIKIVLIRTKLSQLIKLHPELLQTHRSYLINSFHFKQFKNQNGKHFLILKNDINIPVSKTFLKSVQTKLNFTTK